MIATDHETFIREPPTLSPSNRTSPQQPLWPYDKKKRTEMTEDKLERIRTLWKREPPMTIKEIATIVGMSYNHMRLAIKRIVECEELSLPLTTISKQRGRKPKRSAALEERVKQQLTGDRTATIASVVAALNEEGVDVQKSTVWRMAHDSKVSFKRTVSKPREVLTERIVEQRFLHASIVWEICDDLLFFLDESLFNLHIGIAR